MESNVLKILYLRKSFKVVILCLLADKLLSKLPFINIGKDFVILIFSILL